MLVRCTGSAITVLYRARVTSLHIHESGEIAEWRNSLANFHMRRDTSYSTTIEYWLRKGFALGSHALIKEATQGNSREKRRICSHLGYKY